MHCYVSIKGATCPLLQLQVDRNEGVYNIWIDPQDQPQQKYVGQLSDLRAMDIRSFAGIPVRELQREFNGRFGGHLTFFNSPDEGRQLPPNAPVLKDKVCLLPKQHALYLISCVASLLHT